MSDEIKSSSGNADASMTADRRCYQCGYSLRGLPTTGQCPECGADYNPGSRRLPTWPSAVTICLRVGWPLIGLALSVALVYSLPWTPKRFFGPEPPLPFVCSGYFFLVAAPINGYFQVRSMLKRHLPQRRRTTGVIAFLRGLGTLVCVLLLLLFLGPLFALGACLLYA